MSILADRRSRLARRVKLLEKELSAVDSNIRTLSRRLDRRSDELLDRNDWTYEETPELVTGTTASPERIDPSPETASGLAERSPAEWTDEDNGFREVAATIDEPQRTAVPYYKRAERDSLAVEKAVIGVARSGVGEVLERSSSPAAVKERTSYLAGGGLAHSGPLRQERRIQRNKAIFLIIFFFLVLFVVCFSIWR